MNNIPSVLRREGEGVRPVIPRADLEPLRTGNFTTIQQSDNFSASCFLSSLLL
jgi:hypothetical protein